MNNFKMTGRIITAVLMLFASCTLMQAQQVYFEGSEEILNRMRLNKSMAGPEKLSYSNVEGNPFLFRDFAPGRLVLKTGEVFRLDLRYDIYSDNIQFIEKDEIFDVINPDKIALVNIDTAIFVWEPSTKSAGDGKSPTGSFYILKTDGYCRLLVKKNVRVQDAEEAKPYQEAKPARFIHSVDNYLLKTERKNVSRIGNKKELLDYLDDKRGEVEQFMKSNKLGVKDVNDLARVVKYYDTLQ